jgi:cytochrome c556
MRRGLLIATTLAFGVTAALAQNAAVIKSRQDLLEEVGDAVKPVGAMFKGEADFDLAKVQNALAIIQKNAPLLPPLFPDDSKTGGDTEALPKIWENKADFEERFKKLADAAKTAEAAIKDEDTFPDAWKTVVGNCSGCHKQYRKPKG